MSSRVAVIAATGTARKRTIPAIRAGDICDIAAIQGRDPVKLAAVAREFAIPLVFAEAEAMLDAVKPDFVFIASPPFLHAEHVRLCLERRIPVLCEKPLALASRDAAALAAEAERHGVPLRIGHHLRHAPVMQAARAAVQRGELGALRRASMEWSFWLDEASANARWKLDAVRGGPHAFYDAGVHVVDMMLHLLPPPVSVTAYHAPSRFRDVHDSVSAYVRCGDLIAELAASWSNRAPGNDLLIQGDAGTLHHEGAFAEGYYGEVVRDFIGVLEGRPGIGTTPAEAVRALEVLEAMTSSMVAGDSVSV